MATYNYSEISDFEFESLCRDLLQAELGLTLELFAPGPDSGIDIRYVGRANGQRRDLVAQCKRWADGSYRDLVRYLTRVELPKIEALAPSRYILMTSVGLSPARKDEIVNSLRPWIHSPSDVFGKDDISGLLASQPEVERRHIKLWLTSTEVLDALLNSDISNRSEAAVEDAKSQLRLWVPNPSYYRAREILEKTHVCVISGAPGIGKTMLANILLTTYQSLEYEPVVISSDIEEGERAWRSRIRQIFYYDDFLGQITYGEIHLQKNEESRLSQFMTRVRRARNKRFILTTREYILSEALNRYDHLSAAQLGRHKSIVSLRDYTSLIRAKILYNHLFFSDLSQELKASLIPGKKYWDVIRHRNYNPRAISHVVEFPSVADASPPEFVCKMLGNLDDPEEVWASIFGNLPAIARQILLAMASLPSEVLLEDVRTVVEGLQDRVIDSVEFRNAIALLEGTFVSLREARPGRSSRERVVEIRDPSVLDYLWSRLRNDSGEVERLLDSAVFFEQCMNLYAGGHHLSSVSARYSTEARVDADQRLISDIATLAEKCLELIRSISPLLIRYDDGGPIYMRRHGRSLEQRALFFVRLFSENQINSTVAAVAKIVLRSCRLKWENGHGSSREGVHLVKRAKCIEALFADDTVSDLERALLHLSSGRLEKTEDFAALVELSHSNPDLFAPPKRGLESWRSEFREFVKSEMEWLLDAYDDPDLVEKEFNALHLVAEELGEDIAEFADAVEGRITWLYEHQEYEPDEDEWPESYSETYGESSVDEVDALFNSLR